MLSASRVVCVGVQALQHISVWLCVSGSVPVSPPFPPRRSSLSGGLRGEIKLPQTRISQSARFHTQACRNSCIHHHPLQAGKKETPTTRVPPIFTRIWTLNNPQPSASTAGPELEKFHRRDCRKRLSRNAPLPFSEASEGIVVISLTASVQHAAQLR